MPSAKTWIWIILGFIGVCLLALVAVAGAGVYWVGKHVHVEKSSNTNSQQSFEKARAQFKDQAPLLEMDQMQRPHQTRRLQDLPSSEKKPTEMVVMAWDTDKERLVEVSIPFWLLKFGKPKIDMPNDDRGFDVKRLNLDFRELERVGPILIMDMRTMSGERVLVWTR